MVVVVGVVEADEIDLEEGDLGTGGLELDSARGKCMWAGRFTESKRSVSSCLREEMAGTSAFGFAKTMTSDVYTILDLHQILQPKRKSHHASVPRL